VNGITSVKQGIEKLPKYPKKLPGSFWGITTFFNPDGNSKRVENYRNFRKSGKAQGLNLLCVELAFDEASFELDKEDADKLIQLRTSTMLWQKERLFNVALENLPKNCDKVAWLDADILFNNNKWITETSKLLESYKVVQPYSFIVRLPENKSWLNSEKLSFGNKEGEKIHSMGYGIANFGKKHLPTFMKHGHTGFAWAARKSILDKHGFYDRLITGSGDSLMAHALYGSPYSHVKRCSPKKMQKDQQKWMDEIFRDVEGSVYYTPGLIFHLWHAHYKNKRFHHRLKVLEKYDFNPQIDIKIRENGCWQWATEKDGLHKEIRNYFWARNKIEPPINKASLRIWSLSKRFPPGFGTSGLGQRLSGLRTKKVSLVQILLGLLLLALLVVARGNLVETGAVPLELIGAAAAVVAVAIVLELYTRIQWNINRKMNRVLREQQGVWKKEQRAKEKELAARKKELNWIKTKFKETEERERKENLTAKKEAKEFKKEFKKVNIEIKGVQKNTEGLEKAQQRITQENKRRYETQEQKLEQIEKEITRQVQKQEQDYRNVESLFSVFSAIKPGQPLPKLNEGNELSPEFAKTLISLIGEQKPKLVLELGSGISTLIAAYALKRIGKGKIVSLECDRKREKITKDYLAKHKLTKFAKIIYAPLKRIKIGGKYWDWYDRSKIKTGPIDLLVVNGPQGKREMIRYPAMPTLYKKLSKKTAVLVNNTKKENERGLFELWLKEFKDLELEEIESKQGIAILRKTGKRGQSKGQRTSGNNLERYVISKRNAGFGDCLTCASVALKYAIKTNRTLAIDWRYSNYLGGGENLFSKFFETPKNLGVDVVCDDRIGNLVFPQPFFPPSWNNKNVNSFIESVGDKKTIGILHSMKDIKAETFVINTYAGKSVLAVSKEEHEKFLSELRLKPKYWNQVKSFHKKFLSKRPVIGVQVRHGNGENSPDFLERKAIKMETKKFVDQLKAMIVKEGKRFKGNYDVFLSTDSKVMIDAFKKAIPSVIVRKKWLPPPGAGPVHKLAIELAPNPEKSAADALIDMYLLSFCDVLLCKKAVAFCFLPINTMKKKKAIVKFFK
jgi:predicted O-methyltransferase YrrM